MELRDYQIMAGDRVTAEWKDGVLTVVCDDLLPLYLKRVKNPDLWLETRAVDTHRTHSRLLKKALRMAERDDLSTVKKVFGAAITDRYWIRPIGSDLSYRDIRFKFDYYADLALKGDYDSFDKAAGRQDGHTPELTNIGSFEKCWKLRGGSWWMYKAANQGELFSELFACRLGEALGMNMAYYEKGKGCIKSSDFTRNASVNFEPASAFMGDEEDYEKVLVKLKQLCSEAIPDYIRMIFLDTLLANPDRHTNNFGLLRDAENGQLLGLAPAFDHNMALIARGYPKKTSPRDFLIGLFRKMIEHHPEYKAFLPDVEEKTVRTCIEDIHMRVKKEEILAWIMSRCQIIMDK